ncbi:uncharacterized protein LOC116256886 isoform X2 [Nymphaea colorata]|uniref:uncharacterized protein LOC116256886 isoform X2 n=1 Tax=Nymphaea colorata TaxID=210225 RepID=UPI00129E3FAB|nr:uncharacterized protein LOC116256886 isoform X2 [Nymphaea colorata]
MGVSKLEEALEIQSLRRIISAFLNYPAAARQDVKKYERSFEKLSPKHKALLPNYLLKCQKLRWCISINSFFVLHMLQAFEPPFDMSQDMEISENERAENSGSEQFQATSVTQSVTSTMQCSEKHVLACTGTSVSHDNQANGDDHDNASGKSPKKMTYQEGSQMECSCNYMVDNCAVSSSCSVDKHGFNASSSISHDIVDSVAMNQKVNSPPRSWFDPSFQLDVPLMDVDKVRCVIRSIVRDWTVEGQRERDQCYKPILDELNRLFPDRSTSSPPSCLVPGAGLGRLALEISCLGFISQGNEFSYYMMICSSFILNQGQGNGQYILGYIAIATHFQTVTSFVLLNFLIFILQGITEGFSMCAGDFVEVYNEPSQEGAWDSVVTCFFIDTAHNIVEYIEVISKILRDGGVWINLGPLLYHFADAYGPDEMSIELSLDDVKRVALHYGLELEMEKTIRTTYTANPRSMMQNWYSAAFWTMRKRRAGQPSC